MNSMVFGLVLYFCLTMLVGLLAMRRNKTIGSYLLADRKLGPWVAAFSERASGESAWLLIGLPGVAFVQGFTALWVGVGCVSGIAFSWLVIARRLREQTAAFGALTLADYFEARLGDPLRALRLTATLIILFFFTFYVAAQFLAAGKVLNVYLGVTPMQGMFIGAVLVLFYTAAGGLYAVAWTDLIQGIIMLTTLSLLPLAVLHEVGGPGALCETLAGFDAKYIAAAPGATPWAAISGVLGALGIGLGYMGQPHLVLRFMAISSAQDVSRGRTIAITWALIAFTGAVFVGLTGLAHFGPEALGEGLQIADQEQLMPLMARSFMPEWIAVIMICGAIAAMMSTADSQLLSSASAVSEDIYHKLLRPDAAQRDLLAVGRWATLAIAVIAFLMAWKADAFVYSLVLYAWAGLGSSFGPPLLLSLWWRGTSRAGALAGLITGTLVVVIWYNVPVLKSTLYEMIPGFAASLAVTWLVSMLCPPTPARAAAINCNTPGTEATP